MDFKPEEYRVAEIEQANTLFLKGTSFMLSVASLSQLPPDNLPEVAFAGRSNVGKSSLINALTKQKNLAKASNTPGRTQQLNYFNLAGKLYLVDMPGYGYAQAPDGLVKKWQQMILTYLQGRASLKRVFLLIDSRQKIKKNDLEIMDLLDKAAVTYQIVLTKTDKISTTALDKVFNETALVLKKHAAAHVRILPTSSEKGIGLDALRVEISSLI